MTLRRRVIVFPAHRPHPDRDFQHPIGEMETTQNLTSCFNSRTVSNFDFSRVLEIAHCTRFLCFDECNHGLSTVTFIPFATRLGTVTPKPESLVMRTPMT